MKNVLITGCNGQLGLELQIKLKDKFNLILTNRNILDITKYEDAINFINEIKPDIIINCAAFTDVDLSEEQEYEAYKVNALGPKNLAIAASEVNAKLIHISTDYVFDGEGIKDDFGSIRPYYETDATNPQSAYGRTKLQGEKFIIENTDRYFIIRTAWLYGEGKNFVRTMINLSKTNKEVSVVNDQIGTPTSTTELANMIEKHMNTDEYGIYHGTCEGQCSWYDFAVEIFRLSKIDIPVEPVTSEQFVRPAPRPKYSVLENKALNDLKMNHFRPWQVALAEYLKNLK